MSYQATTFNVMIASPGDVQTERDFVREIIYEWNAANSFSKKIVLLPVGWETHTHPEMGASPQTIINQQIVEKCDLLVGIFWSKIGTPTQHQLSGTVEEIEQIVAAEKPAMLYFSKQNIPQDIDIESFKKLGEFKKSCQNRSLYKDYNDPNDFKNRFRHDLNLIINNKLIFKKLVIDENSKLNSNEQVAILSNEAKELLKEACLDDGDQIVKLPFMGGFSLKVGEKEFTSSQERWELAKWENAINQLLNEGFIYDKSGKGQMFQATYDGYQHSKKI